uniref:Endothelin-like toxin domain-containing protein n=1 Tax=Sinocyclocheilus rhinocerous TaxID=307959 RepID=A0A673N5Y6_9TELE
MWTTLLEGKTFVCWGLPLVPQTDPSDPSATHRVRSKRCSCNNQLDSECHYFLFTHAWANLRKPYVSKPKQKFNQCRRLFRGRKETFRTYSVNLFPFQ